MTYIYITADPGLTIEDFRAVTAKHDAPQDLDGLLAWTAGAQGDATARMIKPSPPSAAASAVAHYRCYFPAPGEPASATPTGSMEKLIGTPCALRQLRSPE